MKRRLNILCILAVLIVCYPVVDYLFILGSSIKAGWEMGIKDGMEAARSGKPMGRGETLEFLTNVKPITVIPDFIDFSFTDSIYNVKSGEHVPVIFSEIGVGMDTNPSMASVVITTTAMYLNIIGVLIVVLIFISLIISINKSKIFNWDNVNKLRWLGVSLIFCFICAAIPYIGSFLELADIFKIKGYQFYLAGGMRITTLILGIVALIFGEIFAIGLKMKEEQDLTI